MNRKKNIYHPANNAGYRDSKIREAKGLLKRRALLKQVTNDMNKVFCEMFGVTYGK